MIFSLPAIMTAVANHTSCILTYDDDSHLPSIVAYIIHAMCNNASCIVLHLQKDRGRRKEVKPTGLEI